MRKGAKFFNIIFTKKEKISICLQNYSPIKKIIFLKNLAINAASQARLQLYLTSSARYGHERPIPTSSRRKSLATDKGSTILFLNRCSFKKKLYKSSLGLGRDQATLAQGSRWAARCQPPCFGHLGSGEWRVLSCQGLVPLRSDRQASHP